MAARTLEVTFLGDSRPLQQAMTKVEESTHTLSAKFSGLTGALGNVASVAGGFMAGQLILKGPSVLMGLSDSARDLELQMKKATTVFGDQLPVVEKWAAGSASAMGLSKNQAVNLASGLQDLLIPMGFTREAATKMTTETLNLAGALAEWSGGQKSAAEVSDILTKAYLGETDGLKALGISISADEVNSRLAAAGKAKLTGAALDQAKALEIQKMVLEKSTDAQKAFAEGSDSAARKQAEMNAKIAEAKEKLAVGLAPAFVAVTTLLATALVPALDLAMKGFSAVTNAVGVFIGDVKWVIENGAGFNEKLSPGGWAVLAEKVGVVAIWMRDTLVPALKEVAGLAWDGLAAVAGLAWGAMRDAWAVIQPLLEKAASYTWGALTDLASASWGVMKDALAAAVDQLNKIPAGKIRDEAKDTSNWADAWVQVREKVQPAVDALRPFVEHLLVGLQANLQEVKASLGRLNDAFGEFWAALKPLQPVIEPLAKLLAGAMVLAIAANIEALNILAGIMTLSLVTSIEIARVAILAMAAVIVTVTEVVSQLVEGTKAAAEWIGHWLNVAGGAFNDFQNMAMGPINAVIGLIDALISKIRSIPSPSGIVSGIGGAISGAIPGRASGGPVTAGQAYIVGEEGPELLLTGSDGYVVPSLVRGTQRGAGTGGGGDVININIHGPVFGVDDLVRTINLALKRSGRPGIA